MRSVLTHWDLGLFFMYVSNQVSKEKIWPVMSFHWLRTWSHNLRQCTENGPRWSHIHCLWAFKASRHANMFATHVLVELIVVLWCHMASSISVNIGLGGLGGISSEILLGQWHPAGATPHHAKPILCLWLEIWALHQVLLTSMQHGFLSRPPVKNGLDAVCTDVVRWLHTSELGFQSCG